MPLGGSLMDSWRILAAESPRALPAQRAVEDQAVALVVIHYGAPFVRVVVRAPQDTATAGLHSLGRGVDVGGLDADDNLAVDGMVHCGRQRYSHRPTVEGREMGSFTEFHRHPQGFGVEP